MDDIFKSLIKRKSQLVYNKNKNTHATTMKHTDKHKASQVKIE